MTNSKSIRFLRLSVLVALGLTSVASTSSVASYEPCVDKHESKSDCLEWAWYGECDINKEFMHDQCRQSCGLCTPTAEEENKCENYHQKCRDWAEKGNMKVDNLCKGNWNSNKNGKKMTGAYVVEMCPLSCNTCDIHLDDRDIDLGIGLPQSYDGMETDKELFNLLKSKVAETRAYVESIENEEIREVCKMSHPHCARFALSSDCDTHFDHPMIKFGCAAACQTCDKLVDDNGIIEARYIWGHALREFNEKKLAQETITAA